MCASRSYLCVPLVVCASALLVACASALLVVLQYVSFPSVVVCASAMQSHACALQVMHSYSVHVVVHV